MQDDFGYFGSGASGYAHYTQTHNACFGGSQHSTSGTGTGKHGGNNADDVSWSFIFKLFGLSAVLLVIDYILTVLL